MELDSINFVGQGAVYNPFVIKQPDSPTLPVTLNFGQMGESLASELRGVYGTAAKRGVVFHANAVAITLPVVASAVVSLFTLYNPVNSGIDMELIDSTVATVVATTVISGVGVYFSSPALTALGTFTTQGTAYPGFLGGPSGLGQFWSSYTHSGTPVLQKVLGGIAGAVTNGSLNSFNYVFDGKVIIPPGVAASILMTTAHETTSGAALDVSWVELIH